MKNILIAGATGGIGQALVQECLQQIPEGQIWALGRNEEKLARLQHPRVKRIRIDTIEKLQDEDFIQSLKEDLPKLHLVIYAIGVLNRGDARPEKSLAEVTIDNLQESLKINATGAMLLAKILKPHLRHDERSVFLCLSAKVGSIGDNGLGGWYSYRMSKAALNMGVRTAAIEFRQSGCQTIFAAVHPGTTLSDFSRKHVSHWDPSRVSSVEQTAKRLLELSENLRLEQSGSFLHWDGSPLPW